jgi:type VI secretion system protein ImpI
MLSLKLIKGADHAEGVKPEAQVSEQQIRFVIGRDPSCDWQIPDRTLAVSGRHCEILFATAEPVLRDVSTNGTFVNGSTQRISGDHQLRDGDLISMGPYQVRVSLTRVDSPSTPAPAALRPDDKTTFQPHAATLDPAGLRAAIGAGQAAAPPQRAVGRGGDPAAMLLTPSSVRGADPAPPLPAAALPGDEATPSSLTIIRPAPKPAPRGAVKPPTITPAAQAAPSPQVPADATIPITVTPVPTAAVAADPSPTPAAAPSQAAASPWLSTSADDTHHLAPAARPGDDVDLLRHLAEGLGVPYAALADRDPAELAGQLGALTRIAVGSLRQLIEQQARARRQLRSRQQTIFRVRESNPLRFAPTVEDALLSLLAAPADAKGQLQQVCTELGIHHEKLLGAFRGASQRLGEELDPRSLERAIPGDMPAGAAAQAARKARLWDLYSALWQSLGQAADQPWSEGFVEAAQLQLTAAYDDTTQK